MPSVISGEEKAIIERYHAVRINIAKHKKVRKKLVSWLTERVPELQGTKIKVLYSQKCPGGEYRSEHGFRKSCTAGQTIPKGDGKFTIFLYHGQKTVGVLMHELAHATGAFGHDANFFRALDNLYNAFYSTGGAQELTSWIGETKR